MGFSDDPWDSHTGIAQDYMLEKIMEKEVERKMENDADKGE